MLRISLYACSNETPSRRRAMAYELPRPLHGAKLLQRLTVRNQEVGFLADDREAGRHHADHRSGPAVGGERHVEHVRAAAKASLPEFVAQHDDRAVAAEILLGRVGAAERRLDAERAKDVGRDGEPAIRTGWPLTIMVDARGSDHAQMLERSSALAPGDEVGRGDHVPDGAAAVGFPHRHDPIGLAVRQRLQHHRAHHAEDRGGRADAEGQRHQRRRGKAGRPSQHASAMTEITDRVVEQRRPDLVARALPTRFESCAIHLLMPLSYDGRLQHKVDRADTPRVAVILSRVVREQEASDENLAIRGAVAAFPSGTSRRPGAGRRRYPGLLFSQASRAHAVAAADEAGHAAGGGEGQASRRAGLARAGHPG